MELLTQTFNDMKNRNIFYSLVACALLLAGCAKEEGRMRLRASVERFARDTKVGIIAAEDGSNTYVVPVFANGEVVNINGSNYSTRWDADGEYLYFSTDVPQPAPGEWYIAQTPTNLINQDVYSAPYELDGEGQYYREINFPTEYQMRPFTNNINPYGSTYNVYYDNLPLLAINDREATHLYFRNLTSIIAVRVENNMGSAYSNFILEEVVVRNWKTRCYLDYYSDDNSFSLGPANNETEFNDIRVYPYHSTNTFALGLTMYVPVPVPPSGFSFSTHTPPTIRIEVKGRVTETSTGKVYRFTYAKERALGQHILRNQYFTAPMTVDRNSNMVEWTQVGGPINPGTGNHEGFSNGGSLW